ncbi:hypothetical protein GPECTOR_14g7 [Gonium pectorale]|uniref:Uncharacterized protein n=1 Tax=Gonium pectorale TaxID=33097 RepID=A0A150GMJ3_GONPE|nr:hypothetical protein GPECTOR_14g7 [Gonium pectorale]|eukprot:KXZ51086.1 hypothetical protein GPECTOR_14g7 [Gonium pectorale]
MNSPDSQTAGPERTSPDTDDMQQSKMGRATGDGKVLCTGVLAAERAYGSTVAVGMQVSLPAARPLGSEAACGTSHMVPEDALANAFTSQQQQGAGTQIATLQKQHLKLLPAVEAARPGDVPDPDAINRILQQVLDMESRMGSLHPETGRAYVLLARVLEHKSTVWSLTMAERALLRAWTIIGMGTPRRCSESGAAAVAGVAAAAAAESGAAGVSEMLGQLPDSFNTFHFVLEQIRIKLGFLQWQQQQQMAALVRLAVTASVAGNAGGSVASAAAAALVPPGGKPALAAATPAPALADTNGAGGGAAGMDVDAGNAALPPVPMGGHVSGPDPMDSVAGFFA